MFMPKVYFKYYFDSLGLWNNFRSTLAQVKDLTDRLDRGLVSVQQSHSSIECEVMLSRDVYYVVSISGESDKEIGTACDTFVRAAGSPNRVEGNFRLAEPVLMSMGYGFKRNWRIDYIIPMGREVVRPKSARSQSAGPFAGLISRS